MSAAPTPVPLSTGDLVERARRLATDPGAGGRAVLGIVGAPGAGKSTLAEAIVAALGPQRAVLVGMDGFHLEDSLLRRLGLRDRKGAIDTFDDAGYAALVERLAHPGGETVYAPWFDRENENALAGAVPVPPEVPLVVTEGNYLLADQGAWPRARARMREVWFLAPDEPVRQERLVARHRAHGKSEADAVAWSLGTDQRNAELVAATAARADLVVRLVSAGHG
ncbi:nucleoside/nucleotide kinase family protein [Isoptericola cucumis]|uniref:Nucleoside/nucleotide kinase family protein n=1 Tax=Isoptericola cucumis TaxID=1776856 RepID=A0ABQ2B484_9MICO|nr:nucleoside/nucleotide kinase family protein [Isoptericola cucumis]GGI07601.1 nucleoside/nucleotide kinase family protein [Isoptericola cucumis]